MNAPVLVMLNALALVLSFLLTRWFIDFAIEVGIMDTPNERSSHTFSTPRAGGVAIALVFSAAALALWRMHLLTGMESRALLGAVLVAAIGFWDDVKGLSPSIRFIVQFIATIGAIKAVGNIPALNFGLGSITSEFVLRAVAVLGLMWLINLTNFMDGIDGIAAAEAITTSAICFLLIAYRSGLDGVALSFALLAVSVAGFSLWNWPPAKVFMGDCGSGFLGYSLGVLALIAFVRHSLSIWTPVLLLGVFIVDATWTLGIRALAGAPLASPHRQHAYQHAADRWGHRNTTLVVIALNFFWLAPWAVLAETMRPYGFIFLLAAWAPLVALAYALQAGTNTSIGRHTVAGTSSPRLLVRPGFARPIMRAMSSVTAVFEKMSPWFLTERLKQRASYFRLALLGLSVILSVYLGFATRFDAAIPGIWLHALPTIALIWALVTTACFAAVRAHRSFWGFLSVGEMLQLILVTLLGSAISAGLVSLFTDLYVPRSVDLLIAIYSTIAVAGGRFVLLCIFESAVGRVKSKGRERVLILGADATGVGILFQVQRHCPERKPIGFVDAKPEFSGAQICGLPVFGAPDIPGLKSKHRVKELLVSSSNLITSAAEKRILSACQDAEIRVRSVALISDEFINRGAEAAKELSIERLLGRESVCFQNTKVTRAISGRVMMVTGAAGSIGSEICRQLAKHGPAAIVGYEVNETALFYLEREMRRSYPDVPFIPCIGSVQNASRLAEVLCTSKPAMVFHAAAYKHVPLMEQHLSEAIENNIFGTDNLLTACANHGVSTFVMLSTDKAVRPTNMMGVTKRIAELIVRSSPSSTMTCVSVRFGNVLGSNGSVIPVFHSQIERGGPVTVTHPDMTRYFMTIPEAAQLVLEASSLGRRNEIYILDMGEPVKIVDLARRMIQWKGLKVGEEIKIEFSGIRPGEKLSEELQGLGEQTAPTQHSKIAVLIGSSMPHFELRNELNALRIATQSRDFKRILSIIQRLVPDYVPSTELLAHVENLNPENAAFYADEAA